MNPARRLIFGMLTGFGSVGLRSVLNIVIIPVMLSCLGIERYSLYVLLIGLIEIITMMDFGFTYGLTQMMGKYRSQNQEETVEQLLFMGQRLYFVIVTLAAIAGFIMIQYWPNTFGWSAELFELFRLCMYLVVVEAVITLYEAYFGAIVMSHGGYYWINVSETICFVLGNGIGLILILNGFGLFGFLATRLVAAAIRVVILMSRAVIYEPKALRPRGHYDLPLAKSIFNMSFHAMVRHLSGTLSYGIDRYVVAFCLPLANVGILEIVVRITGFMLQICRKMTDGLFPIFTRFAALNQTDEARRYYLRTTAWIHFLVCHLIVIILCFYPTVFHLLAAGKMDIQTSFPLLIIALPVAWLTTTGLPVNSYLYASGFHKYLSVSTFLSALMNVVCSVLFVKLFGLPGVLLGTLVPLLILNLGVLLRPVFKTLSITPWQYISNLLLGSIVPLTCSVLFTFGLQYWLSPAHTSLVFLMICATLSTVTSLLCWLLINTSTGEKNALFSKYPAFSKLTRFFPTDTTTPSPIPES